LPHSEMFSFSFKIGPYLMISQSLAFRTKKD
jgi:hypothetical protein